MIYKYLRTLLMTQGTTLWKTWHCRWFAGSGLLYKRSLTKHTSYSSKVPYSKQPSDCVVNLEQKVILFN
jgi:hypothetical protein